MAVKPKPEEPPASKAYLVSFGDTMTALLAFFIVLLSLADDQTGMNSHTGTGSFVKAMNGVGLPGAFTSESSSKAVQKNAVSPLYLADDLNDGEPEPKAKGPDEDNHERSIDLEIERFQQFLNELERHSKVESMPETDGEVVFDVFNKLNPDPPHLGEPHREALKRVLPVLSRDNYRVEIVVWAAMPSVSHWRRAVERSTQVMNEVVRWASLDDARQQRLVAFGKPWKYADVKRPVMSIIVRKQQPFARKAQAGHRLSR